MSAILFLCIGCIGAASRAEEERDPWRDLELPQGMQLDLARGVLARPGEELGEGCLVFEEKSLVASPPLRALARPAALPPSRRVRRDDGSAVPRADAVANAEFVFDLGGECGAICVSGARDVVRLEIATRLESVSCDRSVSRVEGPRSAGGAEDAADASRSSLDRQPAAR
jgi:hypothetical protein